MRACYCTLAGTKACSSCSNFVDDFVYRPIPPLRDYPFPDLEKSLLREITELKEAVQKLIEEKARKK